MLTLHHLATSRSQRILWLLEELGLPYELKVWQRDPKTRLAPAELKAIHPMGKSPVLVDGDVVVAESGAILEYLAQTYGANAGPELAGLQPAPGTPQWLPVRYWMHFAEGSAMNWLVMKLIFTAIPRQPMPFFAKPIARKLCETILQRIVSPNIRSAVEMMDKHLATHRWVAGDQLTVADFQMSFVVEAALVRADEAGPLDHMRAYRDRLHDRPAYQRAIAKGGPVVMAM